MTDIAALQRVHRKLKILEILQGFNRDLEGYSYFSASMGVSEDDFEDVADQVLDAFFGTGKPYPKHAFVPHAQYPWFCAQCGYSPSETLIHETP